MTETSLPAPTSGSKDQSFLASGMLIVVAIALAKLAFHCYFNNQYDYFRDEFDYMACGNHPAWGYVDQPPLIPFLIHIWRAIGGDSLRSIRFIPALASSLLVMQTAVLAREFGGRRFALLLSAITVVVAPQYLSNGSLLGTNCLEPNLWMGCAYFAVLAIKRNDPRYWLWFGVVAGLGLEEKYSIAVFGLGIVTGLLLTAHRRVFLNPRLNADLTAFLVFCQTCSGTFTTTGPLRRIDAQYTRRRSRCRPSSANISSSRRSVVHPLTVDLDHGPASHSSSRHV
jgi:4-amino-4-deoxy-L-arabinose transferase-like glycosyltransferase